MQAVGTIGTVPAAVAYPCPWSARNRITPSAAASPKAEPPASTIASTRVTVREGSSKSTSRVAGAPPRTSAEPTEPEGNNTTVTPVELRVTCPTRTPGTAKLGTGDRRASGRRTAHVAREVDDQPVELVGPLEHQHVAAAAHHLQAGTGDELRDAPRLERRRQDVGGPDHDQRRDTYVRELTGEVETDEHTRRVPSSLGRTLAHHLADEIDVARTRVLAEADARGEEPQVLRVPQPLRVRGSLRDLLEPCFRARRPRPERGVRERGQQHDAGDALGRDVGKARDERLHRDAAQRMTDEHSPPQIETFEH